MITANNNNNNKRMTMAYSWIKYLNQSLILGSLLLGVISLFTNVHCLIKQYKSTRFSYICFLIFPDAIRVFATTKSHFIFVSKYYEQTDGVTMGSPVGPVLANIFMRVSQRGSLFPCSLPKLPYVSMFPHVFRICSPFNECAYNVFFL